MDVFFFCFIGYLNLGATFLLNWRKNLSFSINVWVLSTTYMGYHSTFPCKFPSKLKKKLNSDTSRSLCNIIIYTVFFYTAYFQPLDQRWANSALRGICVSETVSRVHVVDSFLSLLLRVTILFWRYVIIKCKKSIFILTW